MCKYSLRHCVPSLLRADGLQLQYSDEGQTDRAHILTVGGGVGSFDRTTTDGKDGMDGNGDRTPILTGCEFGRAVPALSSPSQRRDAAATRNAHEYWSETVLGLGIDRPFTGPPPVLARGAASPLIAVPIHIYCRLGRRRYARLSDLGEKSEERGERRSGGGGQTRTGETQGRGEENQEDSKAGSGFTREGTETDRTADGGLQVGGVGCGPLTTAFVTSRADFRLFFDTPAASGAVSAS